MSEPTPARAPRSTLFTEGAVWLLAAVVGCGDDAPASEAGASESGSGDAEATGSTDAPSGRVLTIPAEFELCAVSPSRSASSDKPLFHYRGVLRLDAGVVPLPDEPASPADAWLPYTTQAAAGGPAVAGAEGLGAVRVEADTVPSAIYFTEAVEGWETAIYTDNPAAMTVKGDRLLLQVAYPTGSRDFDVTPILELDREMRLSVLGFVPALAMDQPVLRARAVPCVVPDATVDRLDVTLAEGSVSFHTRAATWRAFGGFTVLASGEVDGIAFEVDDYWDLEYKSNDFGSDIYGDQPLLAVRFGAQQDGSCILVVEPDWQALEGSYLARILDCEQNTLRDLTVTSIDVVLGGGEPRW